MTEKEKIRHLNDSAEDLDEAAGFFRYSLDEDNVDWKRFPEEILRELEDLARKATDLLNRAACFRMD